MVTSQSEFETYYQLYTKSYAMGRLEDLEPGAIVRGILPSSLVTVTSVKWYGSDSLKLTYGDSS